MPGSDRAARATSPQSVRRAASPRHSPAVGARYPPGYRSLRDGQNTSQNRLRQNINKTEAGRRRNAVRIQSEHRSGHGQNGDRTWLEHSQNRGQDTNRTRLEHDQNKSRTQTQYCHKDIKKKHNKKPHGPIRSCTLHFTIHLSNLSHFPGSAILNYSISSYAMILRQQSEIIPMATTYQERINELLS